MKLKKKELGEYVIAIVGCGRSGSDIAKDLVNQGFKNFILLDYTKDESKDEDDRYVVETLRDELLEMKEDLEIIPLIGEISLDNVQDIFEQDLDLLYLNIDVDEKMYSKINICSHFYKKPIIYYKDYNRRFSS